MLAGGTTSGGASRFHRQGDGVRFRKERVEIKFRRVRQKRGRRQESDRKQANERLALPFLMRGVPGQQDPTGASPKWRMNLIMAGYQR
jgi:hypothetical protein